MTVEAAQIGAVARGGTRAEAWWAFPAVPLLAAAIGFTWMLHGMLQRAYGMTGEAWDLAYHQQEISKGPREHGARIRPSGGMGGDSGPPRRDVGPVRPHPDVQRGPGVHRWCHRDRDVGLRRARRQEALAIHPLPGGRVVPHRDRDRAAALSQRRAHRIGVLPAPPRP